VGFETGPGGQSGLKHGPLLNGTDFKADRGVSARVGLEDDRDRASSKPRRSGRVLNRTSMSADFQRFGSGLEVGRAVRFKAGLVGWLPNAAATGAVLNTTGQV
jgi:hypothetical protein